VNAALVQAATMRASQSLEDFNAAMLAFRLGIVRSDPELQEIERERAVVALGDYCDQMMIANREQRE
jgi:hypothetical protein